MDKYGRKKTCIVTTLPFIVSWLVHANAKKVWNIYLARVLAGFGGGESIIFLLCVKVYRQV